MDASRVFLAITYLSNSYDRLVEGELGISLIYLQGEIDDCKPLKGRKKKTRGGGPKI